MVDDHFGPIVHAIHEAIASHEFETGVVDVVQISQLEGCEA